MFYVCKIQVKSYTYWLQISAKSSTSLSRALTAFFWSSKITLIAVLSLGLLTHAGIYRPNLVNILVDSSSWLELDSRILSSPSLFAFVGFLVHLFRSRAIMNFIATLGDPVGSALLGLPSIQRKRRIHCRYNCTLMELLILPCNIVHKSSDNTFSIAISNQ